MKPTCQVSAKAAKKKIDPLPKSVKIIQNDPKNLAPRVLWVGTEPQAPRHTSARCVQISTALPHTTAPQPVLPRGFVQLWASCVSDFFSICDPICLLSKLYILHIAYPYHILPISTPAEEASEWAGRPTETEGQADTRCTAMYTSW